MVFRAKEAKKGIGWQKWGGRAARAMRQLELSPLSTGFCGQKAASFD
jgi:hypothetical protein